MGEKVSLEPLMASVFLTFFSNIVDKETAFRVIDRFLIGKFGLLILTLFLEGEKAIVDIVKHVLKTFEAHIMSLESFELQVFLKAEIYRQAINQDKFFPNDN